MKTIALFGGAFDPPHLGHTTIVGSLLGMGYFDRIVIAPTGVRIDKGYHSPIEARREMIEIWFDSLGHHRALSLDFDILDQRVSEGTYDHNGYFLEKYDAEKVVHIFGTDTISTMQSWEPQGTKVAKELEKIFFQRIGYTPDWSLVGNYTTMNEVIIPDVSSTMIRDGDMSLLTPEVREFILKHHLYESSHTDGGK